MKYLQTPLFWLGASFLSLTGLIASTVYFFPTTSTAQTNNEITIVALGDSLTVGIGASDEENNWVSLISQWSNIDVINAGVSGDTSEEAFDRLDEDVISEDPDIVIVMLGGNDVLELMPFSETEENINDIIDELQEEDIEVILVGEHGDFFQRERERGFQEIAQEQDVRYVPNVLEDILGERSRLSDPVHPNDEGYQIVAKRIWDELEDTLNEEFPNRPLSVTCDVFPRESFTNEDVTWRAFVWGGEESGDYEFDWDIPDTSDDDDDTGTSSNNGNDDTEVTVEYDRTGAFGAQLTVQSGDDEETVNCLREVRIEHPPLVGHCEVDVSFSDTRTGSSTDRSLAQVEWHIEVAGGREDLDDDDDDDNASSTNDMNIRWSGTDGLSGNDETVEKEYASGGEKIATAQVTKGGQSMNLTCRTILPSNAFDTDTDDEPLEGSCSVDPGNYSIQDEVQWNARGQGGIDTDNDNDDIEFSWSGTENLTGSSSRVEKEYETPGTKTARAHMETSNDELDVECQIILAERPINGHGSSDCFIATAAFGTSMEPEVTLLRDFRDEKLLTNRVGKAFVDLYYTVSPPIADFIREDSDRKAVTRALLRPVIEVVEIIGK